MIIDRDGRVWWTTEEACAQLGVKPHCLWNWVKRGKVDRPVRKAGRAAYLAEQLMEAERETAASGVGPCRA